jgi:hypothetical protein
VVGSLHTANSLPRSKEPSQLCTPRNDTLSICYPVQILPPPKTRLASGLLDVSRPYGSRLADRYEIRFPSGTPEVFLVIFRFDSSRSQSDDQRRT